MATAAVGAGRAFLRHIGEPFGLREVEFSLLMLLLANAALVPKQLARALALSAPNLTLILDRLEQRDLVRRERNPADQRSRHVVLTAAGERLARAAEQATAAMEAEASAALSSAEHAMLIELLGKLARGGAPASR